MKTAIKEKPIIFSGDSIRSILAGKKTVTRRVVSHKWLNSPCSIRDIGNGQEIYGAGGVWMPLKCPYVQPGGIGSRLWVQEAFHSYHWDKPRAVYRADGEPCRVRTQIESYEVGRWTPPIHMPRWASRITLEVKSVRVERLQEITEAEAIAEGITDGGCLNCGCPEPCGCLNPAPDRRDAFIWLWDQLNADRGYDWLSNPWVWRVEFERIVEANQG